MCVCMCECLDVETDVFWVMCAMFRFVKEGFREGENNILENRLCM